MRRRLFTMSMSTEERARLEALAAHFNLSGASVIRMLLKREADVLRLPQKDSALEFVKP